MISVHWQCAVPENINTPQRKVNRNSKGDPAWLEDIAW